jgi:hypothetical protein
MVARKSQRESTGEAATTETAQKPKGVAYCPQPIEIDPSVPQFKHLGGSKSDEWNMLLANQVSNAGHYSANTTEEERQKQYLAQFAFLAGVNPQDVIEGMMAAQLFASHAASMECYRRAMSPNQNVEWRHMNLVQAAKLTRANAAQVEALAKHRSKGKQKITIEHVHVYQGGQAAFIANGAPGEGVAKFSEVQPHAIPHAASAPMRCENSQGLALSVAGDAKRTLPDARGPIAGRA